MDWLKGVLTELKGKYILFDLPGMHEHGCTCDDGMTIV